MQDGRGARCAGIPVMNSPDRISLPSGDIHLWFCHHRELGTPALEVSCRALLAPEELAQEARFHLARDQYRYLLTRVLVRTVLSRYAPVQPQAWRFHTGQFGRPSIARPAAPKTRGLDFNLSHTSGLIVLGLARQTQLGVDVENVLRPAVPDIADLAFTPAETDALRELPLARQSRRFFELWTLKESYVKARGMGLRIPLNKISFTLDDTAIELALDETLGDAVQHWQLWQLQPSDEHVVSVCATRGGPAGARIVCRDIAPLQWERRRKTRISRSTRCGDGPSAP